VNLNTVRPVRPVRSRSLSRRTVVVGTAWAVPAVVVATAAPALAASGPSVSIVSLCQNTDLSLTLTLAVTNPTTTAGTLSINSVTIAGVTLGTPVLSSTNIPANSTTNVTVTIPAIVVVASANVTVSYRIKLDKGPAINGSVSASLNVSACV